MISKTKKKKKMMKITTQITRVYETKFKENFYSMSEGNTCIVEPNLEVLSFAIFSTGLAYFLYLR